VTAVFLDAGGTLFAPRPSVGHVYARVARRHGCRVSSGWVEERFRTVWARRNRGSLLKNTTEEGEKRWWFRIVRDVFGTRFPPRRFSLYFDDLYDRFAHPDTWELFPDTKPVLRRLRRRGFRVGIVSNWDSRLFPLCDRLGVTPLVDFVLASAVVGYVKPDRRIFHEALRRAGAPADRAVHVGDSLMEDYWGARRAGLKAVLLTPSGRTSSGIVSISRLRELDGII